MSTKGSLKNNCINLAGGFCPRPALLIAYIPTSMLALRALACAKILSAKSHIYSLTSPYDLVFLKNREKRFNKPG